MFNLRKINTGNLNPNPNPNTKANPNLNPNRLILNLGEKPLTG